MKQNTTEEKILNAAMDEFSKHGFEGARMDRIAKNGRINKAMIYYHFKNKEQLYETILLRTYREIVSVVSATVPPESPPEEQIRELVMAFINFVVNLNPGFIRIMLRELASGGTYFKKIAVPNLIMPMFGAVNSIFDTGRKSGAFRSIDPAYTIVQLAGSILVFNALRITLEGAPEGSFLFKKDYVEAFSGNCLEILLKGITAEGGKK